MNDFNYDNEIIEISSEDTENKPIEVEFSNVNPVPKKKKTFKDKWHNLDQKTKIGICAAVIGILLLVIGTVIAIVLLTKTKKDEKPKEEPVILEKDNYRYEDGKLIFLDKSDQAIGSYECIDKDVEKCYVAKLDYSNDKFDRVISIYENGEEIIKNAPIYYEKFVFVYDEGKIKLYDISTKESEFSLKSIKTYDTEEKLVVIEDEDSKYGLIKITTEGFEYLFRCSYDNVGIINGDLVYSVVQDKKKHYIVDRDGRRVSDNFNVNIVSASEQYIVGVKDGKYSLYNYEYEVLISDYDYIKEMNGIITLVKDNRLYLRDKDLNKLNEDGIRLENTDYIKKYVYDQNNRLINTKKSYEVEFSENIVTVIVGETTKEINPLEAIVNNHYSYLNYYDGKLYFYSDEEKTDILGTYTCTNKNNIATELDVLNKCSIYENGIGISGIYNNEYVFIYDNANNDDEKYYLYSLKENKVKSIYSSIIIVNEDELRPFISPISTTSSFIIARSATGSNAGNYGVLEINGDKAQGKISFTNKSITKELDYYLVQNTSDVYMIYDKDFSKISNDFNYIKLYDKYYVGISNNKLNVYEYNRLLGILEEDVPVSDTQYEIDFTNGFSITVGDMIYKFDSSGNRIIEESNDDMGEIPDGE